MAIKNWTVVSNPVRKKGIGLAQYGKYLEDKEHRNHKDATEHIWPVFGDMSKLVAAQSGRAVLRDASYGKGRKIESLAHSFIASLPQEIRPTQAQWADIAMSMLEHMNLALKPELKVPLKPEDVFINVHDNPANPHLNIVLGKVTESLDLRMEITQRNVTRLAKESFNSSVLRVMGASNVLYETKVPRPKPKNKREAKRVPQWKYEQQLAAMASEVRQLREVDRKVRSRIAEGEKKLELGAKKLEATQKLTEILVAEAVKLTETAVANDLPIRGHEVLKAASDAHINSKAVSEATKKYGLAPKEPSGPEM